MAATTYIHDGTAHRKVKDWYVHDGSAWRKLKEAWCHDGTSWRKVFAAVSGGTLPATIGTVYDLAMYRPTTSDPYLLHAGTSTGLWRWDGSAWTHLVDYGMSVTALGVSYDGASLLFGTSAGQVFRWNGSTMAVVGNYTDRYGCGAVRAFAADATTDYCLSDYADGGPQSMMRWSGTVWTSMGSIQSLYGHLGIAAGVVFVRRDANGNLVRWNGSAWVVATAPSGGLKAIHGSGDMLYAITSTGLHRWDGSAWTLLTASLADSRYAPDIDLLLSGGVIYVTSANGLWSFDGTTVVQVGAAGLTLTDVARDPVGGAAYVTTGSAHSWLQT